ncbi:hypothetical protein KC614_04460 [candidate division WWE3 bacterium]|uniref:Uncharacterized protein n=1 Tax=candidate division WWE3 bacterium TaxID=2053526 RepID=A0A955LKZ1_UNCKA|nr:hypothetical protein [candidate division WWE3 bacterium]
MRRRIIENATLVGVFDTGSTVTISLTDLSDDSNVALDSNVCSEIGSRGLFRWNTSNITTAPTGFVEYLWEMTDGVLLSRGVITLGGYPDSQATALANIPGKIKVIDGGEIPIY